MDKVLFENTLLSGLYIYTQSLCNFKVINTTKSVAISKKLDVVTYISMHSTTPIKCDISKNLYYPSSLFMQLY